MSALAMYWLRISWEQMALKWGSIGNVGLQNAFNSQVVGGLLL